MNTTHKFNVGDMIKNPHTKYVTTIVNIHEKETGDYKYIYEDNRGQRWSAYIDTYFILVKKGK